MKSKMIDKKELAKIAAKERYERVKDDPVFKQRNKERFNKWRLANRERFNAICSKNTIIWQRKTRAKRRDSGLCLQCGGKIESENNNDRKYLNCKTCRDRKNKWTRAYLDRRAAKQLEES